MTQNTHTEVEEIEEGIDFTVPFVLYMIMFMFTIPVVILVVKGCYLLYGKL